MEWDDRDWMMGPHVTETCSHFSHNLPWRLSLKTKKNTQKISNILYNLRKKVYQKKRELKRFTFYFCIKSRNLFLFFLTPNTVKQLNILHSFHIQYQLHLSLSKLAERSFAHASFHGNWSRLWTNFHICIACFTPYTSAKKSWSLHKM